MRAVIMVKYEGITMENAQEAFDAVSPFGKEALTSFTKEFWAGFSNGSSHIVFEIDTITLFGIVTVAITKSSLYRRVTGKSLVENLKVLTNAGHSFEHGMDDLKKVRRMGY